MKNYLIHILLIVFYISATFNCSALAPSSTFVNLETLHAISQTQTFFNSLSSSEKRELFIKVLCQVRNLKLGCCMFQAKAVHEVLTSMKIPATVCITSPHIWNIGKTSLVHYWVESSGYILDPFPEGTGEYSIHLKSYIDKEVLVIPIDKRKEAKIYSDGHNAEKVLPSVLKFLALTWPQIKEIKKSA